MSGLDMSGLAVAGLSKSYGSLEVLREVDLEVPAGGLTAVLGPSGCGKTTLLRCIAGFEVPDSGVVTIGDRTVVDGSRNLPPERRGVGYVAQEGALFPHLTVKHNICFGLSRSARRRSGRVAELLAMVGLDPEHAERYPHQLSGGQQQRVALARALAPEPSVVLLDEPFAALDAGLRAETRHAVAEALARTATTGVLVTHDQAEALSLADRVAVMCQGRLVQTATPAELYRAPVDLWVARFVGEATVLSAVIQDGVAECGLGRLPVACPEFDGPAELMIRPEQLRICPCADGRPSARVEACTYYGHDATVTLRLSGSGAVLTARCSGQSLPEPDTDVALDVHGAVMAYREGTAAGP